MTTDAVFERPDKLITSVHNKARLRHDDLLRATEEIGVVLWRCWRSLGRSCLIESIPDNESRDEIFARLPSDRIGRLS